MKGNIGEWSEIYVLLRLLADGKIYAADKDLEKIENIFFPIIRIIREETKGELMEYQIGENIEIHLNGKKIKSVSSSRIAEEANSLLESLKSSTARGAFEVKQTKGFMENINCYKLKAPSLNKSDITMQILDIHTGFNPVVGFSIKSQLGSSPTLLNAGKTTNFIYRVEQLQPNLITETNEIYIYNKNKIHTDLRGRMKNIKKSGGQLIYEGMESETFNDNLILIDSYMDNIIAQTLLYFYGEGLSRCDDLVKRLKKENPLNYGNTHAYEYKFKKFLTAVALGMKPATRWNGIDEASGGYIIVSKKGDVLAYHIYHRNYFEDYLLNNTKYETASTTRHKFGELYEEEGKTYIKLNLQIRFS